MFSRFLNYFRDKNNNRRLPKRLPLIFVFITTLVLVIANSSLRSSINKSDREANSLLRFYGLAYQLSALEWQSIAKEQVSSDVATNVNNTKNEMQQILAELDQLNPASKNLLAVRQAFDTYISALTKEFSLIETGDIEQAGLIDEEQVDPSFNALAEILSTSSASNTTKATQMKRVGDVGFVVVIFLNATLIALILWWYRKAEQVIEHGYLDELKVVNSELEENQKRLEQRVSERTADLDIVAKNNERRAMQFEAVSQVIKAISSIQNLETLLSKITKVISEQFNIYHAGIFLLDNNHEFAVLRAANSEGGRKMLEREHKLQVGQTGLVGFVTATGQPRIALDADTDVVYFDNPDLPNTHSEIALPLRYAGQIIGALDVQSVESNAFGKDDIEVLITLADQVATAIKNTLALEEARDIVSKFQNSLNEKTYELWKVMQPKSLGLGFQLSGSTIKPLETPLADKHVQQALMQNKTILSDEEGVSSSLAIPIRLRGQAIGVINLRTNNNYKLTNDDTEIVEAVTERLSLAIESATLLESTQHHADIERLTTDISSKISSSTRFETILQTAAQELSRALGGSDVLVQIEPIAIELGMAK